MNLLGREKTRKATTDWTDDYETIRQVGRNNSQIWREIHTGAQVHALLARARLHVLSSDQKNMYVLDMNDNGEFCCSFFISF